MAQDINYNSILAIVTSNGSMGGAPPFDPTTVTVQGTAQIDLPVLPPLLFPAFQDQQFNQEIKASAADPSAAERLQIDNSRVNTYTPDGDAGSVLLNASRVIINAKEDFAMLFGSKGVAIASPEYVNIDAGKDITLFARDEVFIGIPNAGKAPPKTNPAIPGNSKGHPTKDQAYEPLVLGLKLANWLEDLLFALKDANLVGNVGDVGFQPSSQAEFGLLQTRIPELISTYGFVDGMSHEEVNADELATMLKARDAAKDFVPPKHLHGTFSGTGVPGGNLPPQNPITNPLAELPQFYITPDTAPYGDAL